MRKVIRVSTLLLLVASDATAFDNLDNRAADERGAGAAPVPGLSRARGGWNVADLRRLSAPVMIAILVVGCATTHTPRVTGRVVDKSTGRPVAGADVMVYRYARRFREHGSRHVNFGHRWQKTDAEGRFDFPAVRDRKPYRVGGLLWRLEDEPTVRVTDERYGTEAMVYREEFQRNPDKDAFLLAIEISENERHAICELEEDKRVRFFCRGLYQPGAAHCIEIAKDMRCHEE